MRRAAGAAVALIAAATLGGCSDDAPQASPTVVTVSAQRCSTPTLGRGVATVVDDDLVVTAGHVVEGPVREVVVDGRPATVVALDRRSDLALIAVDLPDVAPAELASATPEESLLVTPDGETSVGIDRHVIQLVDHASDRTTYRREVVVFAPAVERGTSGASLLDASGRLVAVVVATLGEESASDGETYAVTSAEVRALLDGRDEGSSPAPDGGCAGTQRSAG